MSTLPLYIVVIGIKKERKENNLLAAGKVFDKAKEKNKRCKGAVFEKKRPKFNAVWIIHFSRIY